MKRLLLIGLAVVALVVSGLSYSFAQTTTTGNNAHCGTPGTCGNGGGNQIVGGGSYVCNQGNGHNGQNFSAGCTATPSPTPSPTPTPGPTNTPAPTPTPVPIPPPPITYNYFGQYGDNLSTTTAQQTQYLANSLCEGQETTGGGASIFSCGGQTQYWSLNMGQSTLAGHDTSVPFGAGETGTGCLSPAGTNFWASTVPDYTNTDVTKNWFLWPNGATIGSFNSTSDVGLSVYPNGATPSNFTTYLIFMNLASSEYQTYAENVLSKCADHDKFSFAREDNATFGNQSLEFTAYGAHNPPAYAQLKNFGTQSGGPNYASLDCSGGGHSAFGSTRCTRSNQISASDTTTQTYTSDSALKTAWCSMINSLSHSNGSPMKFMINNAFNTDTAVLGCTNTFATQAEKYIVSSCASTDVIYGSGNNIGNPCLAGLFGHTTSFSADNVATVINWCSATVADDPGKQNQVENYAPVPLGSALAQWNFRAHYGVLWACEDDAYPNMMISFPLFGLNVSNDIGRFSPDFFEPYDRLTAYPRRAQGAGSVNQCAANSFANDMGTGLLCTVNGIRDPNICKNAAGTGNGTGNSCVIPTEFAHTFAQRGGQQDLRLWPGSPNYTGPNNTIDLGASCEIYNNTASGVQITATVVANDCPTTHAVLNKVIGFCSISSYFNTSGSGVIYNMPSSGQGSVCSGSSGKDVLAGGSWDDTTNLSSIENEYLPPGDMLFMTQDAAQYQYAGCDVFTANDWFTENLLTGLSTYVSQTVDPNSANIINNINTNIGSINFNSVSPTNQETVDLDDETNVLATPTIQGYTTYGWANDPQGDDPTPNPTIPITTGNFYQEGSAHTAPGWGCTGGDCHVVVLDDVKCVVYESYKFGTSGNGLNYSWDPVSSTFWVEGGGVENLNHPYNVEPITVTAHDTPLMGTTDWGEDEILYNNAACRATSSCVIPHILGFFLPERGTANGGCTIGTHFGDGSVCQVTTPDFINPADAGVVCSFDCTYPMPGGTRLRLHASYTCPTVAAAPQANMVCNQMKQYGVMLTDYTGITSGNGGGGVRFGTSHDGTNPWTNSDLIQLLNNVHITDFDVMKIQ